MDMLAPFPAKPRGLCSSRFSPPSCLSLQPSSLLLPLVWQATRSAGEQEEEEVFPPSSQDVPEIKQMTYVQYMPLVLITAFNNILL